MGRGTGTLAAVVLGVVLLGCGRHGGHGTLRPPAGAAAWDPAFDAVFDDRITMTATPLSGRAPTDVLDQRRLAQRLGFADLVLVVSVDQVWSSGLGAADMRARVDVTLGRVLFGTLPRGTRDNQELQLAVGDEPLPAELSGRVMLLFLRWAPETNQGFHLHLMPADEAVIAWIEALVRHARAAGQLEPAKRGRRRK